MQSDGRKQLPNNPLMMSRQCIRCMVLEEEEEDSQNSQGKLSTFPSPYTKKKKNTIRYLQEAYPY
jgi:hypothetical protein